MTKFALSMFIQQPVLIIKTFPILFCWPSYHPQGDLDTHTHTRKNYSTLNLLSQREIDPI